MLLVAHFRRLLISPQPPRVSRRLPSLLASASVCFPRVRCARLLLHCSAPLLRRSVAPCYAVRLVPVLRPSRAARLSSHGDSVERDHATLRVWHDAADRACSRVARLHQSATAKHCLTRLTAYHQRTAQRRHGSLDSSLLCGAVCGCAELTMWTRCGTWCRSCWACWLCVECCVTGSAGSVCGTSFGSPL